VAPLASGRQKDVPTAVAAEDPAPKRQVLARSLEGEALRVVSLSSGDVVVQSSMSTFGPQWSRGQQLLWERNATGDRLHLAIPVESGGRFEVSAAFTKGPDCGTFGLVVEGQRLGNAIHLYSPIVAHSGEVHLGRVELKAGENLLEVSNLGKDAKSSDTRFGLDWIKLFPVRPEQPRN
jgi:hypothetical protein